MAEISQSSNNNHYGIMRAGDFKYWLIQLFKQRIYILISLQQLSLMQKCYDYSVYGTLRFIIPTQPEWTKKGRNQKKENVLSKGTLMSWVASSFSIYKSCAPKGASTHHWSSSWTVSLTHAGN